MQIFFAWLAGLVFGIGLILSGMTDPAKVIGFLDVAGSWNPSLGFVMAGAIAVGLIAFPLAARRSTSVLREAMRLPTATDIDRRLVLGSVAFGVGWGLAGFCPGPALVGLASGNPKVFLFVAAMLAGMAIFELGEKIFHSHDRQAAKSAK
jgi:uncharacterized membrane protein YedE/YeeE